MSEKRNNKPKDNLYWHSAFAAGIRYEFEGYADKLDIETEHQLSKEALRIDMLVIKKENDLQIEKNIGKIFKAHNIVEYKSPSDALSPDDYNKVKGYAYLYAAFERVDFNQVTITFIVPEITPSLRAFLTDANPFHITTIDDGIHYVQDNSFSIQIIEQKKVSVDKNLFVSALGKNLTAINYNRAINELHRQGISLKNNPFVEVVTKANPDIVKEVMKMQAEKTFEEVVREWGQENGMVDRKLVAKKMLRVGDSLEKIALITDLDMDTIKAL